MYICQCKNGEGDIHVRPEAVHLRARESPPRAPMWMGPAVLCDSPVPMATAVMVMLSMNNVAAPVDLLNDTAILFQALRGKGTGQMRGCLGKYIGMKSLFINEYNYYSIIRITVVYFHSRSNSYD